MGTKHKLTKPYRLLWEIGTKKIIVDLTGETISTTECWRDGINSFETNSEDAYEAKIENEGLEHRDEMEHE